MKIYLLLGTLSFYILVLVFFYFFQKTFLYFPQLNNYLTNEQINDKNELLFITTSDNLRLKSYSYINKNNPYVILFLHGNAGRHFRVEIKLHKGYFY